MESWAETWIFACVRGWNRGKSGKSVANSVVSFQEWKQKHPQRPPCVFHVKRNVNSKPVSCFVSTLECHAKQPPKSRCFVSPRFSCFNSGPINNSFRDSRRRRSSKKSWSFWLQWRKKEIPVCRTFFTKCTKCYSTLAADAMLKLPPRLIYPYSNNVRLDSNFLEY